MTSVSVRVVLARRLILAPHGEFKQDNEPDPQRARVGKDLAPRD